MGKLRLGEGPGHRAAKGMGCSSGRSSLSLPSSNSRVLECPARAPINLAALGSHRCLLSRRMRLTDDSSWIRSPFLESWCHSADTGSFWLVTQTGWGLRGAVPTSDQDAGLSHLDGRPPVLAACRVTRRAEQGKGAWVTWGSPGPAPQVILSWPSWPSRLRAGDHTVPTRVGTREQVSPRRTCRKCDLLELNFHGNMTVQDGKHVSNALAGPSLVHVSNHMPSTCRLSEAPHPWADPNDTAQPAVPVCGSLTTVARGMVISTLTFASPTSIQR